MDLIPTPDQVVSAAANVAHLVLHGGLADLRPMPRTLIDDGLLREVYHYRPSASRAAHGDPVLLVTPLAAPSLCFDLRRGCSLVEHLVDGGRPTYLVEYGEVSFADPGLGLEHWVDEVVPRAVEQVSRHAGGRPVHVVGWSLGALFALLVAADRPDLPIASVTSVGAPVDVTQVPPVAPFRPFLGIAGERAGLVTHAYRLLGGVPKPLVRRAFQLAGGTLALDDRLVALADVTVPVLALAGADDGIAPVPSVRPVVDLLTGVRDLRFEVVPGGHLGMLTGRRARDTTWRILDEWLDAHPAARTPGGRTAAGRTPARRTAAGRTAAGRTAPGRTAAIGANPDRRYTSASSRTLARR